MDLRRLLNRIAGKGSTEPEEEYGPDLFEYARLQARERDRTYDDSLSRPKKEPEQEGKNRSLWILLLLLLLPLFFLLGFMSGNSLSRCSVERYGILHSKDGNRQRAYLEEVGEGKMRYIPLQGEEVLSGKEEAPPSESVEVAQLVRIDFLPDPVPEEEEPPVEVPPEVRRFLGKYSINVSGHRGYLILYVTKKGYPAGTLRFTTWGRGAPEILKWVRIRGNHISFVRSCTGAECARIGATTPIRQVFNGELKEDGRLIEGTYSGGSNASGWEAKRR